MQEIERIEVNPNVCRGKPIIKGTRLTIDFILELLAQGWDYSDICEEYKIERADILAVFNYTHELFKDEQIFS